MTIATVDGSYRGAAAITPTDTAGTVFAAGTAVGVVCTVAGTIKMVLEAGSILTWPVAVGGTILPFRIVRVFATGGSGTWTAYNLS